MQLTRYEKSLALKKDDREAKLMPSKVARAKKQAELAKCKLEEKIARMQADIEDQCLREDIDFENIIEMQDSLSILKRKNNQYTKILEEMFPEK